MKSALFDILKLAMFGFVFGLVVVGIGAAATPLVNSVGPYHTTLSLGQNVSIASWTIELQNVAASTSLSPAATFSIYYRGQLINQTALSPGKTALFSTGSSTLSLYINSTYDGYYAYQKWAMINYSVTSVPNATTIATTTAPITLTTTVAPTSIVGQTHTVTLESPGNITAVASPWTIQLHTMTSSMGSFTIYFNNQFIGYYSALQGKSFNLTRSGSTLNVKVNNLNLGDYSASISYNITAAPTTVAPSSAGILITQVSSPIDFGLHASVLSGHKIAAKNWTITTAGVFAGAYSRSAIFNVHYRGAGINQTVNVTEVDGQGEMLSTPGGRLYLYLNSMGAAYEGSGYTNPTQWANFSYSAGAPNMTIPIIPPINAITTPASPLLNASIEVGHRIVVQGWTIESAGAFGGTSSNTGYFNIYYQGKEINDPVTGVSTIPIVQAQSKNFSAGGSTLNLYLNSMGAAYLGPGYSNAIQWTNVSFKIAQTNAIVISGSRFSLYADANYSCNGTYQRIYNGTLVQGTREALAAPSPTNGCRFIGWTGTGQGSYTGSSRTAGITMEGNITERARYQQYQAPLSTSSTMVLTINVTASGGTPPYNITWYSVKGIGCQSQAGRTILKSTIGSYSVYSVVGPQSSSLVYCYRVTDSAGHSTYSSLFRAALPASSASSIMNNISNFIKGVTGSGSS